jgi:Uma2 family endonuclease
MVMADQQERETHLLMDILRLRVEQLDLPWYLASYLKVTLPRPVGKRSLDAAPDLLMALAQDHFRSSWDIVSEGQPPRFVLEVSSRWSWERDSEEKPRIYQTMGIAEYVVFAPERHDGGAVLFGHRLDSSGHYQQWNADPQGVLWSRELDLGLYVEEALWLRVRDRQGNRLPTPTEWARTEAAAREAEAARANEASRRAAANVQRADEATRQAAAEATARQDAEAEVARLREELRKLREGQH